MDIGGVIAIGAIVVLFVGAIALVCRYACGWLLWCNIEDRGFVHPTKASSPIYEQLDTFSSFLTSWRGVGDIDTLAVPEMRDFQGFRFLVISAVDYLFTFVKYLVYLEWFHYSVLGQKTWEENEFTSGAQSFYNLLITVSFLVKLFHSFGFSNWIFLVF